MTDKRSITNASNVLAWLLCWYKYEDSVYKQVVENEE